jgi:hypothetical protein
MIVEFSLPWFMLVSNHLVVHRSDQWGAAAAASLKK